MAFPTPDGDINRSTSNNTGRSAFVRKHPSSPGRLTMGVTGVVIASRELPLRVLPVDYVTSKSTDDAIGEGGTAKVFSADLPELDDDDEVAVKCPDEEDMMYTMETEAVVLQAAGQYGPGLLALVEGDGGCKVHAWVMGLDGSATCRIVALRGVVMRKARVGCVANEVTEQTPISEHVSTWLGVCMGLLTLHQLGFVHCDVKPDNALVDLVYDYSSGSRQTKTVTKLCDFGFARRCFEGSFACNSFAGTEKYAAPEMLAKLDDCTPVWMTTKIDVFSAGKSLLECVKHSCGISNHPNPLEYILHNVPYGDILAPLLFQCMADDEDDRPDMQEVVERLQALESRIAEDEQLGQARLEARREELERLAQGESSDRLDPPLPTSDGMQPPSHSCQNSVASPSFASASTALPTPTYEEAVRSSTIAPAPLERTASDLPAYSYKAQDCRASCSSTTQNRQPASISHSPSYCQPSHSAGSSAAEGRQPTFPNISHSSSSSLSSHSASSSAAEGRQPTSQGISPSSCLSSLSSSYPVFENCVVPSCFQGSCQHSRGSWSSASASSWDSSTGGAATSCTSSAGGAVCVKTEKTTVACTPHCSGTSHVSTRGKGKLQRVKGKLQRVLAAAKRLMHL